MVLHVARSCMGSREPQDRPSVSFVPGMKSQKACSCLTPRTSFTQRLSVPFVHLHLLCPFQRAGRYCNNGLMALGQAEWPDPNTKQTSVRDNHAVYARNSHSCPHCPPSFPSPQAAPLPPPPPAPRATQSTPHNQALYPLSSSAPCSISSSLRKSYNP